LEDVDNAPLAHRALAVENAARFPPRAPLPTASKALTILIYLTNHNNIQGSTTLSGTSMASPHVAGVAALCLARGQGGDVFRCVLEHATPGRLSEIGAGSPNLLLYARASD
jgi:subtilisin family serine protease